MMGSSTNILRFPVEQRRRQTFGLVLELSPDVREVQCLVATFALSPPGHDIARLADVEMAETILNHAPDRYTRRYGEFLHRLQQSVVGKALAACRDALDARAAAFRANGEHSLESVQAMVGAHILCEEVRGACRAIRLAREDVPWTPRTSNEDLDWIGDQEAGQVQVVGRP